MKRLHTATPLAALIAISLFLVANSAQAAFHLWTFSEFFSNADGSVQFIEMVSSGPFETVAGSAEIRTTSGSVFDFPANLTGNTSNRRLLIATPGFADLPGAVTPDFTLPKTSFFDPAGDTIRLFQPSFNEFHSRTFTSVPTDGIMSRNYPPPAGTLANNTPTNYLGAAGSINLAPPATTGDYNGDLTVDAADYTVWRDTLGNAVDPGEDADGDGDGMIDEGDYEFWKSNFGDVVGGSDSASVAGAIIPEPGMLTLAASELGALLVLAARTRSGRKPAIM
jgi:hypothetical protein